MTLETNDTTNNTSVSSGISLDMDVHGELVRATGHHPRQFSSHPSSNGIMVDFEKEYHVRCEENNGDSFNTFGDSFMMDSFANGESFTSSTFYNHEPSRYCQQRYAPSRLADEMSSILIIEEESEDACTQDDSGKVTMETPPHNLQMCISSTPNTFAELPC